MKMLFVSIVLTSVLVSCSSNKPATKQDADSSLATENKTLEGTYWILTELNGKAVAAPKEGEKQSFIYFDASKKRVSVSGGCNVMGGSFELMDGNRIKFGQMMSTMMACPDMTNEDGLKKMADLVDSYAIQGENLIFAKARMAPTARFKTSKMPDGFNTN